MSPYRDQKAAPYEPSPVDCYVARIRFHLAEVVAFVCVLAGCAALLAALNGCNPRTPAQAEALYTAEQLRCVDVATTLAESKACRAKVDERWGVRK